MRDLQWQILRRVRTTCCQVLKGMGNPIHNGKVRIFSSKLLSTIARLFWVFQVINAVECNDARHERMTARCLVFREIIDRRINNFSHVSFCIHVHEAQFPPKREMRATLKSGLFSKSFRWFDELVWF